MKSEICKTELTLSNLFDLGGSMQKTIYTGYNATIMSWLEVNIKALFSL